jgi:hypothetical protein
LGDVANSTAERDGYPFQPSGFAYAIPAGRARKAHSCDKELTHDVWEARAVARELSDLPPEI